MAPPSWVTSHSCSPPPSATAAAFIRFLFLSLCPQRFILSTIDGLFILSVLILAVRKLLTRGDTNLSKPLLPETPVKVSLQYKLIVGLTAAHGTSNAIYLVFFLALSPRSDWFVVQSVLLLLQAIGNLFSVLLFIQEKRDRATKHPAVLRIYWVPRFVLTFLTGVSGIIRIAGGEPLLPDDVLGTFAALPISAFCLYLAITGSTGISVPVPIAVS